MQNLRDTESSLFREIICFVVILVAATVGGTLGVVFADPNALSLVKQDMPAWISRVLGEKSVSAPATPAAVKPESPALRNPQTTKSNGEQPSRTIPIGLPSIGAFRYSLQSGSAHIDFELESTSLVKTGVLDDPDRIFIDLQEDSPLRGMAGPLKARTAVNINDDLVAGVRVAQWESGATRIVFDLKRSCELAYRISHEAPPRLILDIRAAQRGATLGIRPVTPDASRQHVL